MQYEGIAILGFPRSGTTLLRRLIDAHPDVACPGETYLLSACSRFFASHSVVGAVPIGVRSGLRLLGFETSTIEERVRNLAFDFYRDHLNQTGKRVWAEKTATDAFHTAEISRVFGKHLAFVVLVRHPLDVVISVRDWCQKSESYPPELHPYIQQDSHPLTAFARAWVDVTRRLLDLSRAQAERVFFLRYEDLVADARTQMQRLLSFLGLPWSDDVLEAPLESEPDGFGDWKTWGMQHIERDRVGRWKQLSTTTITELAAIVNPLIHAVGYESIEEADIPTEEDALRRYLIALRLQAISSPKDQLPGASDP